MIRIDSSLPKNRLLIALALGVGGFALNGLGLPVFGITEILFGGVFTLFATYWLGPWLGGFATALAFSRTWLLWGHPWGMVGYVLEAIVVGWLQHRRGVNPLLAALAYWLLAGMPLTVFTSLALQNLPFPHDWAVVVIYPLNSLLMAVAALPVYRSRQFRQFAGLGYERDPATPLRRILVRRFIFVIALPIGVFGLVVGRMLDQSTHDFARQTLLSDARELAHDLQTHLDRHQSALILAAHPAADNDPAGLQLAQSLRRIRQLYPDFIQLQARDPLGRVVVVVPPEQAGPEGIITGPAGPGDHEFTRAFRHGPQRTLLMGLRVPWVTASGRQLGSIEAFLKLDHLIPDIDRNLRLKGRTVVVVDHFRQVIAVHGGLPLTLLSDFGPDPLHYGAHEDAGEAFVYDDARAGRLERFDATRQRLADPAWELYLAEPSWRTQRLIAGYYLACLLGALATAGLTLLLAREMAAEITQPFQHLATMLRRIGAGETPATTPPFIHGSLELAEVSRELQSVTYTLSHTNRQLAGAVRDRDRNHAQLRQLLSHLEEKVAARTRELEEARRAAEAANAAKSEFLASMSHELRTPLNVIVGMSELIAERNLGPLNERQAEGIAGIHESGRHLLELINDILDLSKIEAGMLELVLQPTEVAALCEASIRFVREAAHKKNLTLETSLGDAPAQITADERRLKQVLVNLLANAVKFTPAGGRVGLAVHLLPDRPFLRFEVWDTGIGIARADFERIFQPFQQIDSSLARQYAGTGLGLTLVRRMVQLHGGTVDVQSEPGRGSRFGLEIPVGCPAAAPAGPDAAVPSASPLPSSRLRLLIAEDNDANNAVYTAFFEPRGCELIRARNGLEAIRLAAAEQPDLVLMDVQMPEMDGLEAIRRLRADPLTAELPIIAVTALAMPEDRRRCLEAGASAYLSKPVELRELGRLVARHARRPASSPSFATPL